MIKSFTVDNFKSLINFTFTPVGLNLFIGSNNAGKTNICHALRFLSLSSQMLLDYAATACTAEAWNLLNVYIRKDTATFLMTCDLSLGDEKLAFSYELTILSHTGKRLPRIRTFTVLSEVLRVSGEKFEDQVLIENNEGRARVLNEVNFLKKLSSGSEANYIETNAPVDSTVLCRLYDLELNARSILFKRYLASWGYYNLDPAKLRSNTASSNDFALDSTGSNLSSVIYNLHNARPRLERTIMEAARVLEPRLDLFSFQSPDPDHVYMFFEDGKGNKFGVDNVSDGTLRYLAICYLLLAGDEEKLSGGAPLTIIEEPENGIFVGHLKTLFEKIEPSGSEGQLIFTSHSPYFIDLFDAAVEGLFLIKADNTHSILIRPDPAKVRERLGKFSLGELHFRGLIE
jgi:predicted ATPase